MKFVLFCLTFLFSLPELMASQGFESWKRAYAKRAAKRGLPKAFVMSTLDTVQIDPKVIQRDKNQVVLDKKIDYRKFIKKWMREKPSRIDEGRKMLKKHAKLLNEIEKKYDVEKEVIVSLWGVETFYGKIMGDYDLVRSLATLAYQGRRRRFFETQLNATLRLLKDKHVQRHQLKGSWAGATGQCQFMPSNIPVYGQDYDKDGKIDLWDNHADIFASIAYLLKRGGWKKGKSIGSLALNTQGRKLQASRAYTKQHFHKLGFRDLAGNRLNNGRWNRRKAAKIPMQNAPVVLRGSNYRPLMRWNNSSLFAAFNILLIEGFRH